MPENDGEDKFKVEVGVTRPETAAGGRKESRTIGEMSTYDRENTSSLEADGEMKGSLEAEVVDDSA